uniref:Beta-galactosidase n=1 Tax=Globodera rostochiensis TaxID=31243 RepID=A0A914I036_GLORO
MHYFRIHPSLWQDRLWRYRAAGLNAVQLYIPWNFHEPTPAKFNFAGDRNVSKFIRMAQKNELNVLIRLGPYICAEFEFGGLPWWLIKYQADIVLRSSNKLYLHFLRRWYNALLSVLKPLLYKNGGPILMLQIENEYGSVACDHEYMRWLRDLTRDKFGDDVVLYTTDGPSDGMLRCGPIEHTLTTVDFGVPSSNIERNIEAYFALQQKYSAGGGGPRVNSEFYTTGPVIESMDVMWRMNASFSILMFHGGTSFGFWSGKETSGPIVTSYDFGAPIGEEGAITPLYQAIRDWIGRRRAAEWPSRPMALPANRTGVSIDGVFGLKLANFVAVLNSSSSRCLHSSDNPLNFEAFDRDHGFVWYSTTLETDGTVLTAPELRDHAYVFLDGKFQGNMTVCDRTGCAKSLSLKPGGARKGQKIDILVENIGRLTYPVTKVDPRGLFSPLFLDGKVLGTRWVQCGVDLEVIFEKIGRKMNIYEPQKLDENGKLTDEEPAIYVATFTTLSADWTQMHTFFDSRGWGHGILMVNGFNLGRYWPTQGPQLTLFVPGAVMKRQNVAVLIELSGRQKNDALLNFVAHSIYEFETKNDGQRAEVHLGN